MSTHEAHGSAATAASSPTGGAHGTAIVEHEATAHTDAKTHEAKGHGAKSHEAGGEHHGADAHGGDDHGGGHGGAHGGHHKSHEHDHGPGTPPWLISFGDMMTLFLCFFIMLVTMAKTQDAGLMAKGLGPFVASLEMSGNDGAMGGGRMLEGINRYRTRFGLEPLTEEQYLTGADSPHDPADIEKLIRESMRSTFSLDQPLVASFAADSAELSDDSKHYLDLLASSLRPGNGQVLVLEGHAEDAGDRYDGDNTLLALRRAIAVADYYTNEHGFVSVRVEPRAWPRETKQHGSSRQGVDARLMQPIENESQ